MYLSNLKVLTSSGEVIRDIPFHKGLNIILGERCIDSGSTNSIGKTTLLRAIDFCLGGDEKPFYQDKENKEAIDQNVFNFFYYVEPIFKLELKNNLDSKTAHKVIFEKRVSGITTKQPNKLKITNLINNNEVTNDEYNYQLKDILFNYNTNKPTFRQLITKFIRKDDQQINYILRFLHQATSDLDYEVIHFFLFGYPNPIEIEKKFQLEKEIKQQKNDIKVFDRIKPAGLDQVILLTQKELDELIKQRDDFKINEKYSTEEDKLNTYQNFINDLDQKISTIDFEITALNERKNILLNKEFNQNTDAISLIYNEAKLYNLDLEKKFEETVSFHNKMLQNEIEYINSRVSELYQEENELNIKRSELTLKYSTTLDQLAKYGSLAEYTKLNNQINEVQSKLSNALALHEKSIELNKRNDSLNIQLKNLNNLIEKNINTIQSNIGIFNKYFSEYCKTLFNQTYYLSADPNDKGIHKFKINSLDQNFGSGKKLSLVVAFDLAYSAFIRDDSVKLPYPSFSTQDKVEIIDIQELYNLALIAKGSNGQLIFPIINDKFSGLKDFEENVILKVSKKDRFFRIEQYLPQSLYIKSA
ncbi:AAA family ATPase [Acinetobacter junii]|uniref:AAA family ATPase n=1 Tax=Acinetobacter junii TaxID=40215 RepID=UPI001F3766E1|nr:AAA family ATPase [Acinetobacter junii]